MIQVTRKVKLPKKYIFLTTVCVITLIAVGWNTAFVQKKLLIGTSYVSQNSQLSSALTEGDEARINLRFHRYLLEAHLPANAATQVKIATVLDPCNILLCRFHLSQTDRIQFMKNKKLIPISTALAFSRLTTGGCVDADGCIADETNTQFFSRIGARNDFNYGSALKSFPYRYLNWWPISRKDYEQTSVFCGVLHWQVADIHPGVLYYVLWDKRTDTLYLVGW